LRYKNILLTGGSGNLGTAIRKSGLFKNLLAPSRDVLDITKPDSIRKFFEENEFDVVIHCAALARMRECEENPGKAIEVNIIGTSSLVNEVLKSNKNIRFMHISTDGVYPGTKGNYSEKHETIPYNIYCWTKLGAECAVNVLKNKCIIRTSFFNPEKIRFDESATDAYSSKMPIKDLVKAIATMLESDFKGTINIGHERKSDYDRYKDFKPSIKPCRLNDILKTIPFEMARDASMDCSLWKRIKKENKSHEKD